MKFIVASIATDEIREIRELTFPNKQSWCERNGYIWAGVTRTMDAARPPAWSKLKLLTQLCEISSGDWAFWSDADSIVTRPEWKLEEIADNNFDLIIAQDRNGINTGAFLIRLGNQTWQFLRECYDQIQYIPHRWWDQAAMRHVLESGWPFRIKYADKILINAYPDDFVAGRSAILHVPNAPKIWPDRLAELRSRLPFQEGACQHR